MDLKASDVVEFRDGLGHTLATVVEVDKSLLVETESGESRKITARALTFHFGGSSPLDSRGLRGFASDVDSLVATASEALVDGWELALEDSGSIGAEELSDLLLSDTSAASQLATLRAVRDDGVRFKMAGGGRYLARSASEVETLSHQKAKEAQGRALRADALASLVAVCNEPIGPGDRRAATDRLRAGDGEVRALLELLEGAAVYRDDFPRRGALMLALDELAAAGLELGAKGAVAAFDVLVRLGVFSEHEDLTLRQSAIPTSFAPELEAAAAEAAGAALARFGAKEDQVERVDWTHLEVVTIDDETTRDIDDGVSVEVLQAGHVRIGIHIADPAASVDLDSPLELEARRRGTSVYLPAATIPMFPRPLSEGSMSLVAGQVRPALSFVVDFDERDELVAESIVLSWVRSRAQLSYAAADEILKDGAANSAHGPTLRVLSRVTEAHREARLRAGAVIMNFPEVKVRVVGRVEDGQVRHYEAVHTQLITEVASRRIVQELMILAGRVAGTYCSVAEVPVAYRVQPRPNAPEDAEMLSGKIHELIPAWRGRRKMPRSAFQTTPEGHFGLGLEAYVQATSPIRRYGDLVCHRQVRASLSGEPFAYEPEAMMEVIGRLGTTTGAANSVERESKRYWTLVWLSERVGEVLDGIVVGFVGRKADRASVHLDQLGAVHVVPLAHKVTIGDAVRVRIESANPRQDTVALRMVAVDKAPPVVNHGG